MVMAELNENSIATMAGDMAVYNYDGETREYLSTAVEYLALGVGIPANSCTDSPCKPRAGFAICRTQDLTEWEYITDHRGKTVYSTHSGEAFFISDLCDYPADTTEKVPATQYDTWDGVAWVTDIARQHAANIVAAEQQKAALIDSAMQSIGVIQLKLQASLTLTTAETEKLNSTLDYIDAVTAIDTVTAPDTISWPDHPEL